MKSHRLICFTDGYSHAIWRFKNGRHNEKLAIEETLSLNDFTGVQVAVNADLGIGELPSMMCAKALEEKRLIEVLPHWKFSPLPVYKISLSAVYPSHRNLSRLVRLFKDYCVDHIDAIVKDIGL